MGQERENLARLEQAYKQWHDTKARNTDPWMDLLADNLKFRSLGEGAPGLQFAERRATKQEVRGYFESLLADWELDYYKVHKLIAQDDWVAMLGSCKWTHKRTGAAVDTPKADFWRFENGKAVAFYEFYDTAQAVAAAG